VVESDEVEALPEYKDVGDSITTASGERRLWQPEQEFASGPDRRLKFSGKINSVED